MPADIQNIKIGVNLIDDYLLTQEAPVANGLTRELFTVVQNPAIAESTSELLTIDGDGKPVHFYPDSGSQSGWSTTTISVAPPANTGTCNRIVGFYHENVLNALFYYPLTTGKGSAAVWMQSAKPGTWSPASLSPQAQNVLGFTYQTDQYIDVDGNAYLYGISGNYSPNVFFIITYVTTEVNGEPTSYWEPIAAMFPTQFTPAITDTQTAAFRLTEGRSGGNTVTVLWVDDNQVSHQDGTITWTQQNGGSTASFAFTGESSTFNPNLGTLTADNLYAIPGDLGSGNMLVLDSTSKLYWISDFYAASPSMTALTGGTNQPGSAAAVGVGIAGADTLLVTIFAIEPGTNYLWYLQQTSTTALTFGDWVQLGGTLYALNCPPSKTAVPELFSAGPGNGAPAAYHTGQNLSAAGDGTYIWATHKVSAPPDPTNTTPTNTATYSMEVQALDSGQNPVANGTVTVTADQALTVIWNSVSYHIGPNTPLEVELDGSGQATVLFEAVDLKPAAVTFTAYDTNNTATASRWCRGDVVEYIQSLDGPALTPLSDSVAPQLKSVTGTDLISAGLTGGNYSQSGPANTAAEAVNSCGGYMVQNDQDTNSQGMIDTSRIKVPHWQIDFSHSEGPRFRILTDDEAKDFLAGLPKPGDREALGSFGSAFGDVAHFFKHEFAQLEKFTATLQSDVLHIVFNDLPAFTIATIKQAGAGLETIFSKIKQIADEVYTVIKDVIAFLKMLFDWDDILNTHNVIKECVTQTLTNINGSLKAAESLVDNGFATLQAEVKKVFADLESNFEPVQGQSFSDFVDQTSGSQNTLAGTDTQNAQQQHASKCKYVYSRSKSSFNGPNAIVLPSFFAAVGDTDPTAPITDAVNQYIYSGNPNDQNTQTFNASTAKLQNFVTGKISDPTAFFDLIIVDLLTAAEDLVLFIIDGLEYVINAAFTIAPSAIEALTSAITATIDIPVITWIWKNVITKGDDFTLLDLICLILAVPTTILYKLIGSELLQPNESPQAPFSASDVSTIQTQGLPWPAISGQIAETDTPMLASGSQLPSLLLAKMYLCSGYFLTISAFLSVIGDTLAWTSQQSEDESPNPLATFLSLMSVIPRLETFGTGAPVGILEKPRSQWSDAEQWTMWLWCARGSAILIDFIFTAVSIKKAEAKWGPKYGPALKCTMAVGLEAVGSVAAYYQLKDSNYSGWVPANDWTRPAAALFKPILYAEPDSPLWVPIPWLLGIDVVGGIASSVTQIGATVYTYKHSS